MMIDSSLHLRGSDRTDAEWVTRHGDEEVEPYVRLTLGTSGTRATVYLTPDRLVRLVETLTYARDFPPISVTSTPAGGVSR